jgi:hypothetical protein
MRNSSMKRFQSKRRTGTRSVIAALADHLDRTLDYAGAEFGRDELIVGHLAHACRATITSNK